MLSSGENLIGSHDGTADQNLLFTDFLTVVRYDNLEDFAAWFQISDPVNHHIYSVRIIFRRCWQIVLQKDVSFFTAWLAAMWMLCQFKGGHGGRTLTRMNVSNAYQPKHRLNQVGKPPNVVEGGTLGRRKHMARPGRLAMAGDSLHSQLLRADIAPSGFLLPFFPSFLFSLFFPFFFSSFLLFAHEIVLNIVPCDRSTSQTAPQSNASDDSWYCAGIGDTLLQWCAVVGC
jgi:hypothetical protein